MYFQVELEKKLDACNREKTRYRQQLERAISKLGAAQKREKDAAKAQLLKEKRELEHMRLRYLAAEEKKVISSERRELEELKNELTQYVERFTVRHLMIFVL
jgi:centrosomal protein CEP120